MFLSLQNAKKSSYTVILKAFALVFILTYKTKLTLALRNKTSPNLTLFSSSWILFFCTKARYLYTYSSTGVHIIESRVQVSLLPVTPSHPERLFRGSLGNSLPKRQLLNADECREQVQWNGQLPLYEWTHTVPAMAESEHSEALAALTDRQLQHLVQLLVGVVGREAQLVKTREERGPWRVRKSLDTDKHLTVLRIHV